MIKTINVSENDLNEIRAYEAQLKDTARSLNSIDPNDHYWSSLMDDQLVRDNVFLESNMVTSWIASKRKPVRILEIGTRTGGSLVALLRMYNNEEYAKIEKILSFDMWREYTSTTRLSAFLSKFSKRSSNINLSERFTKYFGNYIIRKSTGKVRRNLKAFKLKSDKIEFISGNSLETVPAYFSQHPGERFDYILVDGGHDDHTAACDLENVARYVAPGGIILFDDIMPESYNLIGVWNKFKEKYAADFDFAEIHHRKGIAWAIRK